MTSGRLIYLMGASGSGKDSLLAFARARLGGDHDLVIAHRYITRPPELGHENYVSLSEGEFALRSKKGLFLFAWTAHGLSYAVGQEVNLWLATGLAVVVSGSRQNFIESVKNWPNILPILIEAPIETLSHRLHNRNRETAAEIEQRLERVTAFDVAHAALVTIDNSGSLERSGQQLTEVLRNAASLSPKP